MKTLYDAAVVDEQKARLARFGPESERLWGKMSAGQMLAHCSIAMESAVGDCRPPRMLIGRLLGGLVKSGFTSEKPLNKNGPTAKNLIVADVRDLAVERERFLQLMDRFAAAGPDGCTDHPHVFFGKLTAEEWGKGMYKHLDHHLRQFGV
jgi:hypothetical protein